MSFLGDQRNNKALHIFFDFLDDMALGVPTALAQKNIREKYGISQADLEKCLDVIATSMEALDIKASALMKNVDHYIPLLMRTDGVSDISEYIERKYYHARDELTKALDDSNLLISKYGEAHSKLISMNNEPQKMSDVLFGKPDK